MAFTQIGILFAISSIVSLIAEIPFGVYSDNYSRKFSAILGSFFTIIGLSLYLFASGFWLLAIAISFIAIGDAGKSGSVEVILMKTLQNEEDYFHINNYSIYISNAVSGIFIGILYTASNILPFLIALLCQIIMLIIILFVPYSHIEKHEDIKSEKIDFKIVCSLLNQFKYMFLILFDAYFLIPQFGVFFGIFGFQRDPNRII